MTHERQYRDEQSQLVQLATGYVANALNQYETAMLTGGAPGKSKYYHDADGNLIMMTLAGDMNCDGVINSTDTGLLLRAIRYFNGTDTWPFECPALNGDFNGDGVVTVSDINGYSAALNAGWTGPSTAYDWDAENRLVTVRPVAGTEAAGVSKVEFVYDSSWRRVRKTVTPWDEQTSNWASAPSLDRKYLWSGWRLLLETDVPASGGEAVLRSFTWGLDLAGLGGAVNSLESAGTIGGLLAVREYDLSGGPSPADPVDYVYLYDALGNVGQVVDWSKPAGQASAAIVAHYEYDPYGGVTKAEGAYASENAWRFSTKQWDDETGLGYWGYRYYSPSMGRWMSRDPIGESADSHVYRYIGNAASLAFDALGLDMQKCISWWQNTFVSPFLAVRAARNEARQLIVNDIATIRKAHDEFRKGLITYQAYLAQTESLSADIRRNQKVDVLGDLRLSQNRDTC
ncbi:MAG: hypothetical protein IPM18_05485 [Phycisphaerales bacterium]|nr:hypothetical protein [Phycisphaerales bacterium]